MSEALAAREWGATVTRLVAERENKVFEIALPSGARAAMRLHRAGYQTETAIRSELWWMSALANSGVAVPKPIHTLNGADVLVLGEQLYTVVSWVNGRELGHVGKPLHGPLEDQLMRFRAVGRLLAKMHNATDNLSVPEWFTRHAWDEAGFLGDQPFWGRFWENPTLTSAEREILLRARKRAKELLKAYRQSDGDFGLIHSDVLRENVLFDGDNPVLIDFDDCGWGFRAYELASLASQNEQEPHYGELMASVVAGYRDKREMTAETEAMIPVFLMLRRFASCGWIVPRTPPGHPAMRQYAARAVAAATRFLTG